MVARLTGNKHKRIYPVVFFSEYHGLYFRIDRERYDTVTAAVENVFNVSSASSV